MADYSRAIRSLADSIATLSNSISTLANAVCENTKMAVGNRARIRELESRMNK